MRDKLEAVPLHRRIAMGAGYLDGYGEHPGTSFVIALTLLTGAAGAQASGTVGFFGGLFAGAIFYGPMWLWGCVSRANGYLRRAAILKAKEQATNQENRHG